MKPPRYLPATAGHGANRGARTDRDDSAYRSLVDTHRSELTAHCYRMLGSVQEAEDAVQDTFLRAWRGLAAFEGRSSVRSWLYSIATNVCLDALGRRSRRMLPLDAGPPGDPRDGLAPPLVESAWLEGFPDARFDVADGHAAPGARYERREAIELAFVAALQHLPAGQRAVLILRDVLGFSAREVAEALETTVPAVKSALQRARKTVEKCRPDVTQQANLRSIGDRCARDVVRRYVDAWERDDVHAVVAMLTEDATLAMPPTPTWYRGRPAITAFYRGLFGTHRWRHVPTRANGQLAVGCYAWDDRRACFSPLVLDVLTLRGTQIQAITAFLTPEVFSRFGLPDRLPR
jgi:RNA polymerase sigma-70 factor, ECF subfamily